jgi:hypothetical protein
VRKFFGWSYSRVSHPSTLLQLRWFNALRRGPLLFPASPLAWTLSSSWSYSLPWTGS